MLQYKKFRPNILGAWMHLQGRTSQLQQCDGVFSQLHRFVDEREGRRLCVLSRSLGRKSSTSHIHPPPPITLHGQYFESKFSVNHVLEVFEDLKNVRLFYKKIDPDIFTVVINEANVVGIFSYRGWSLTPYIGINQIKRSN